MENSEVLQGHNIQFNGSASEQYEEHKCTPKRLGSNIRNESRYENTSDTG